MNNLDALAIVASQDGVILKLRVAPGAARERVVGVHGDALKVAVRAPPEQGKANARVLDVLAEALGLAARDVTLIAGATARDKRVCIAKLTATEVRLRLAQHLL